MEKKLDSVLRDIADHLGFLGYESEVQEGKQNPFVILRHLRNPNFLLDTFGGVVKCSSLFGLSEEAKSGPAELNSLLNELNRQAMVLKFYTEGESLVLETIFPHDYSKVAFGAFWSMIESDLRLLWDGRIAPFMS
jgi:hypothetical protein